MPHVGIHGLAARYCEEGRAQHGETNMEVVVDEEIEGIKRIERDEYPGRHDDAVDAECADRDEPEHHHRPEDAANEAGALLLHDEEANQDGDSDGHHRRRERWRIDLQSLDGAQHRDRRRDCAIAIEQGRADEADNEQMRPPCAGLRVTRRQQRQHRHDAAFAAVIGAHDQERIFDRDDQDQRPEDQRDHAEHGFRTGRPGGRGGLGGFLQGIEGTGADVAVDDAERADRGSDRDRAGGAMGFG